MRTVLITGGSSGIGLALVKAYLKNGYRVINIDINTPLEMIKGEYHFVYADLRDVSKLETVFNEAKSHSKKLDVFIHCAVSQEDVSLEKLSINHYENIMNVNLTSALFLTKHFVKHFYGEQGRIVFMSSTRAFMSEKDTTLYSISKGALQALTHNLAITLSDSKITVNAVAPGWINTSNEALRDIDHSFHPSKRVGKVEDIVKAVMYITDSENNFLNGETIVVDGGVSKKMIYPN